MTHWSNAAVESPSAALSRLAWLSALLTLAAVLALAGLQWGMPQHFFFSWRWVRHWQQALPAAPVVEFGTDRFAFWFHLLLAAAWSSYALTLAAVWAGGALPTKPLAIGAASAALVLAVGCPPTMSGDVYGYAADGLLLARHGLNPYSHAPVALDSLGEPHAELMGRDFPTIYGPCWVLLSAAVAWVCGSSLWLQVVVFKLLAAAALQAASWLGADLADRIEPGRGRLTFLAMALNPLFLLEGPANGHNDLVMMALVVTSGWLILRQQRAWGCLALGLAVGIKFAPLAALPWVATICYRQSRGVHPGRQALIGAALVLLPTVATSPLLLGQEAVFATARDYARRGLGEAARAEEEQVQQRWRDAGVPPAALPVALLLEKKWPLLLLYGCLTVWVWRGDSAVRWLDAWSLLALGLFFFAVGIPFPWYLIWPWMTALIRWHRVAVAVSGICWFLSAVYVWQYAMTG